MNPARAHHATMGSMSELLDELDAWLDDNWDPDLTVGEWWERLGLAGWAAPTLPTNAYGRGVAAQRRRSRSPKHIAAIRRARRARRPRLLLAAPTIATHGTPEQIDAVRPRHRHRRRRRWCQLFSEPGAGSDLAGLGTQGRSATATSGSSTARRCGPRAARSPTWACSSPAPTPTCPSTRASPASRIDMHQPGVEVRPLREMTGRAHVQRGVPRPTPACPTTRIIGDLNNGWAVANTTLAYERSRPRRRRRRRGAGGGHRRHDRRPPRASGPATSSPSPARAERRRRRPR